MSQQQISGPRHLRFIALMAIILTALNLRAAITALPPLIPRVQAELSISTTMIGVLGMIPTAMFALSAFTTPKLLYRFRLHSVLLLAMLLTAVGQVLRVLGPSFPLLLAGSLLTLCAIGATNALMPVAVRVHFPRHVARLSTVYMFAMQIGMSMAPLAAEPLAARTNWQFSLAVWSLLGLFAAIAWIPCVRAETGQQRKLSNATPPQAVPVWRTSVGIGMAVMFGCTSLVTYALMMFIPRIYVDAGADLEFGSIMLAWWSGLGLLLAFLGPWIVSRFTDPFPIVLGFLALFVIGNVGMAWDAMAAPWLWATLSAVGPCSFPVALTLVNFRARTVNAATALSAFGQGAGYTMACLGPLGFGLLFDISGSWFWPTVFTSVSIVLVGVGSWFATRDIYVEDQLPQIMAEPFQRELTRG